MTLPQLPSPHSGDCYSLSHEIVYGSNTRDRLLAEQKRLQHELADVNRLLNGFAPVLRLPIEVLLEVFHCVAAGPSSSERSPHWMILLAVCHHWHDIICATPSFWSRINVFSTPRWMKLSLYRSRNVAIDVSFLDHSFPHHDLPALLASHMARIRTLAFEEVTWDWDESLSKLFQSSMPALERLVIVNTTSGKTCGSINISPARLPHLRSLKLCRTVVPRDVTSCPKLRVLDLHNCPLQTSFEELLTAIKKHTVLEELSLGQSMKGTGGALYLPKPTNKPPIELPRIRKLNIRCEYRPIIWHILNVLRVPNGTDVLVSGDFGDMPTDLDTEFIMPCLFPGPQTPLTIFPMLSDIATVSLDLSRTDLTVTASNAVRRLSFNVYDHRDRSYHNALSSCLRDVIKLLHTAPVTSISISVGEEERTQIGVWRTFFAAFPQLISLSVSGRVDSHSSPMWSVLREIWAQVSSSANVPCAGLNHIEDDLSRRIDVVSRLDAITNALECRAQQGTKLERLTLKFPASRKFSTLHDMPQLEQLKKWVSDVVVKR
ncbi:hypothetical protein C8Q76DRAFT_71941 [Earliella scabrosa]|nr:hypothetical protein C8Q76DRAFT_71941 [Earliella scabrosa]